MTSSDRSARWCANGRRLGAGPGRVGTWTAFSRLGTGAWRHTPGQSSSVAARTQPELPPGNILPDMRPQLGAEVAAQHERAHIWVSVVAGPDPPRRAHLGRFLPRLGLHGHSGRPFFFSNEVVTQGGDPATGPLPAAPLAMPSPCFCNAKQFA